jgi:hypothetical protein
MSLLNNNGEDLPGLAPPSVPIGQPIPMSPGDEVPMEEDTPQLGQPLSVSAGGDSMPQMQGVQQSGGPLINHPQGSNFTSVPLAALVSAGGDSVPGADFHNQLGSYLPPGPQASAAPLTRANTGPLLTHNHRGMPLTPTTSALQHWHGHPYAPPTSFGPAHLQPQVSAGGDSVPFDVDAHNEILRLQAQISF